MVAVRRGWGTRPREMGNLGASGWANSLIGDGEEGLKLGCFGLFVDD